ncbi:MAG: Vitamin epoxide reductase family protein [Parcubacteria group bacterium]|nr:Vitamin epoxide reductase family protein [Parcubacteria group bacterium]
MTRTALLSLLLVLTFLGLADAWYLTQAALDGTALSCSFNGLAVLSGCNQVAQSVYSHFMGLPLALYGVVFYGVLFIIAAVLFVLPIRILYRAAIALGVIGIVLSLYLVVLQIFVIKALCVYCLASMAIALLIFFVTLRLWKRFAVVKVIEPLVPTIPLTS